MADNSSFITGAAKGAFVDALEGLPRWATEKTALKISGILQQQVKALNALLKNGGTGGTSGMNAQDAAKFESELDKFLKTIAANNKEEEKALKRAKDREKADKKALFGVKEFDNKWQKAAFVLDGLAVVGKKVLDAEKQYLKTYDEMYRSGVNVLAGQNETSDGFTALNHVVALTGIRLETLQAVAQKYSTSINAYGFNKFAKTLATSTKQLGELGFSSKESANLIGAYTETAQNYSDMRGRSEKEMSADVIKFGTTITKLSLATGVSRDQMLNNAKAISKSSDISLLYSRYGKDAADKMVAFASSFPDQALGKELVTMAADTVPALNSTFQELAKTGLGSFGGQLQSVMRNAAASGEDSVVTRKKIASLMETITPAQKEFMRLQAQAGNASAQHAQEFLNNLSQDGRGLSQATDSQVDAAIKTQAAIAKLDTQMEKFSAATQAAFSPTIDQVNILTKSMTLLNDAIYGVINATNSEARSWVGAGAIAAGSLATGALMMGKAKTLWNLGKGATGATGAVAGGGAAAAEGGALAGAAIKGKSLLAFGMLIRGALGAAGDYALGKAGVGKDAAGNDIKLDKTQDDANWEKMTSTEKAISGAARGIEKVGDLFLLDNLSRQAASERIAKETAGLYDRKNTSIVKSPAPSTINSPSAVPVTPTSEWDNNTTPSTGMPTAPMAPSMDKSKAGPDINSILTAQTNLLEQIRLASVKSVEVNENILKYTRNRT